MKPGAVVVAAALAVVLGTGGLAAAGGSSLTGAGTSASSSSRATSRPSERDSRAATARLTARGVRATLRFREDDADCAGHSYGQVRAYLREHHCVALHRALIELRDRRGDLVLLAVAWVEMPNVEQATDLKALMDRGGTGNITELSRERGRYRTVRYTGDAYASSQDGATVVNAQAQPVARGWTGLALTSVVTNAVR